MASFLLTSTKWSSSSKAAVFGGAGSSPAVDLRRFEGLVAWYRHDEPVGNVLFQRPMHVTFTKWFVPSPTSPTNFPFNCLKTAKFASQYFKLAFSTLPYSIYRSWSLWGCSCLFSYMIFLWNEVFLSASASRSVLRFLFFLFLSCRACMCQLPGWQNVILPSAIGNGR